MTFEISRASSDSLYFDENDKPCNDAYLETYEESVMKRVYTPEVIFDENGNKIYPCAFETKINKLWKINIYTLEQLEELQKEVNKSLIINFKHNSIVIYDDYIE